MAQIWPRCHPSDAHLTHRPLHPFAIDGTKLGQQPHGQFAQTIKRVGGIQFIDTMRDRHFLRRWRYGLIVQTAAADPEQVGLGRERQGIRIVLDHGAPLAVAQDGSFFSGN